MEAHKEYIKFKSDDKSHFMNLQMLYMKFCEKVHQVPANACQPNKNVKNKKHF